MRPGTQATPRGSSSMRTCTRATRPMKCTRASSSSPSAKATSKRPSFRLKSAGTAIAIRTGGHQYSGASSTGPDGIQMDLSTTFKSPDDLVYFSADDKSFVRTSVSYSLGEFSDFLKEHHVFVPHGLCTSVHLGGHVQTGGYGMLGRSFGLLGDHVTSLEIIDHNGEEKEINRSSDPELFFAWLGGSPGNFGVLTHLSIEVHRDADYKGSLGLHAIHIYDAAKLCKLLGYLAEMSDDENFPRNYDLCINVVSAGADMEGYIDGLDHKMKKSLHKIFGVHKKSEFPIILVYAQYLPFGPRDKPDCAWFNRLADGAVVPSFAEEKPVSELMPQWILTRPREFNHRYVKRVYLTNSTTLVNDGWANWAVGRIDEIVGKTDTGQWLAVQMQCVGGKNSMFRTNADNGTSYSWRDSTMLMVLDNFHLDEKKEEAEAWEAVNDKQAIGPRGIFSKEDRRVLWGSYGSSDLDSVWNTYHEDRSKYERLMETRRVADPNGTFTPNTFCVKRAPSFAVDYKVLFTCTLH
ncbi:hypothetical protein B0H16DRAFT_307467 [Mycena metata]|uniref:FAD-binding PCMH-type domain-containing protein n=1 Tax=Mycena metata TaxID=1033252 RepID=A0AAD7KHE6_9AGAR|nr:hypothetical protein B0H16DRAFT_307467 [Mycena metata]